MTAGVQRLAPADEPDALAFLDRAPFENAFLSWVILTDRSQATRATLYTYRGRNEAISGVAFFGRQIVLAAEDDATIDAFARAAQAHRLERMIVGDRTTVRRFWERIRSWHPAPRVIRRHQPLMAVERGMLKESPNGVRVRPARADEWRTVADSSAEMIRTELQYDPRSGGNEFDANVRMMIERRLWWVGERDGELCFFCSEGPRSARTLQLQGIWTPPRLRGRGLATAALCGICDRALERVPSISLYVNGFNTAALALYERVGFRTVGEFMSLLF